MATLRALLPKDATPISLSTAVVLAGTTKPKKSKRKAVVLEEEEYLGAMQKIINRDFFPALKPLERSLTTSRRPDLVTPLRQSSARGFDDETPVRRPATPGQTPGDAVGSSGTEGTVVRGKNTKENLSLDKFVARYTSEDNESFEVMLRESERAKKEKLIWIEEAAKQAANNLVDKDDYKRTGMLDTWTYTPKNTLMWCPSGDGVTQAAETPEMMKLARKKAIRHGNTRFPGGFFNAPSGKDNAMHLAGVSTPTVGGYKMMRTPSPAPHAGGATPFMTWGDIVGTPLQVDGDELEAQRGTSRRQGFAVPDTPSRDQLAWKMADNAAAKGRKRRTSVRTGSYRKTPGRLTTPRTRPRTGPRTGPRSGRTPMSPAAREMLRRQQSESPRPADAQLRASYRRRIRTNSDRRTTPRRGIPLTPDTLAMPSPR